MGKKKKRSNQTWVIATADWHVNSTIGLIGGSVTKDDGGVYMPSPEQEWLWDKWQSFWGEVQELDGHRIALVVGDMVESYHHGTVQIVTLNQAVEIKAAEAVAKPMVEAVDEVWVLRGTEAHAGGAGWKEEMIALNIGAVPVEVDRFSHWHISHAWDGVKFDVHHHPRTQTHVPHATDWAATREATYTVTEYREEGLAPPDIIIRAHAHRLCRGYHRDTLCIYLPPWCFTTSFGFRRGAGLRVEPPGGVIIHCKEAESWWKPRTYKPPRAAPW